MLRRMVFLVTVLAYAWAAAAVNPAEAHAVIVTSVPKAGSTVGGPEIVVELHFNSRLDRQRSRLSLVDPNGGETKLQIDASGAPEVLTAHATAAKPGKYILKWQVLAVDGHITRGSIPFNVGG